MIENTKITWNFDSTTKTMKKNETNPIRQILFSDGPIHSGTTLKNLKAPEKGNQALHVCVNEKDVLKNRQQLAAETLPLENWILPWQKHTAHIERVSRNDHAKGAYEAESSILECDGLYTTDPECLIGVFTADCCGIVVQDPSIPLVMVIHSGWKGTVQAIVDHAIEKLKEENLFHPESLEVFFSPSLLYDSFEVGEEVVLQLQQMAEDRGISIDSCIRNGNREGKFYIDNQGINQLLLKKHGLKEEQIHLSEMDTAKLPDDCFSFRRDKPLGEHFTYAYIQKENSHS